MNGIFNAKARGRKGILGQITRWDYVGGIGRHVPRPYTSADFAIHNILTGICPHTLRRACIVNSGNRARFDTPISEWHTLNAMWSALPDYAAYIFQRAPWCVCAT